MPPSTPRKSVGTVGDVYLRIPPGKGQLGKVMVSVAGSLHELIAESADGDELPTGCKVRVVKAVDHLTVTVQRHVAPSPHLTTRHFSHSVRSPRAYTPADDKLCPGCCISPRLSLSCAAFHLARVDKRGEMSVCEFLLQLLSINTSLLWKCLLSTFPRFCS